MVVPIFLLNRKRSLKVMALEFVWCSPPTGYKAVINPSILFGRKHKGVSTLWSHGFMWIHITRVDLNGFFEAHSITPTPQYSFPCCKIKGSCGQKCYELWLITLHITSCMVDMPLFVHLFICSKHSPCVWACFKGWTTSGWPCNWLGMCYLPLDT